MKTGIIYKIYFNNNPYFIYGSTKNYKTRFQIHKYLLKLNKHPNTYLQNIVNKYGLSNLKIDIIHYNIPLKILLCIEDIYIGANCSRHKDKKNGLNIRAAQTTDFEDYIKIKMSNNRKGKCLGINNSQYGKSLTKETLIKISESKKIYRILQYDLDGNFIKEWTSCKEININVPILPSIISKSCRNQLKSAYNYIWKYKLKDDLSEIEKKIMPYKFIRDNNWLQESIFELDNNKKLIQKFKNRNKLSKILNINVKTIYRKFKEQGEIMIYKNRIFTKNKNLLNE